MMRLRTRWCALAGIAATVVAFPSMAFDSYTIEDSYVHPDRQRNDNYGGGGQAFLGFSETDWLSIETGVHFGGVYAHQSGFHVLTGLEEGFKATAVQFGPASLFFRGSGGFEYEKPGSAARFAATLTPGAGIQYRLSSDFSVIVEADERYSFGSPGHNQHINHDLWASIGIVVDLPQSSHRSSEAVPGPEAPAEVVPIAPAESATREVHFAFNSATLSDDAKKEVADIAQRLLGAQELVVELTGSADSIGDKFYNLDLGRRRAEAVERELVADGVVPRRIATRTDGEYFPKESNDTAEGRAANRRVVILIYPGIPELR